MKIRNKKTGEIGEIGYIASSTGKLTVKPINGVSCESLASYISLAELNAEWEDYEEPKVFWAISWAGEPEEYDAKKTPQELKDMAQEIGNYFDTREEAELAVRKLKAWKRLKDNHVKFLNVKNVTPDVPIDDYYLHIEVTVDAAGLDDLKFLFGGEE